MEGGCQETEGDRTLLWAEPEQRSETWQEQSDIVGLDGGTCDRWEGRRLDTVHKASFWAQVPFASDSNGWGWNLQPSQLDPSERNTNSKP